MDLISPPATLKSPIWEHFGFRTTEDNGKKIPVSSDTTCKHCFAGVSYNSGNTSNMTTHVKMHHPCIDLSVRKKNIPHSQLRLQDAVREKMSVNSPQALNISRTIGKFIATDLRPFSIVESAGFKLLLSALEPRHQLPSRTYFSDNIIPELYKQTHEVMGKLKSAEMVYLTTDGWISRATESYITITAHFIDS